MVWTKVCGVTDRTAAESAVAAGADAIGLQLIDSPRHVTVDEARVLSRGLDVERIVLLDESDPALALRILDRIEATGVQPYGSAAEAVAEAARDRHYLVLWPVPVASEPPRWTTIHPDHVPLLDARHETLAGGTGRQFDWSLVADSPRPFVLAGGLAPDNVARAVASVRPWGVDASSGLESTPGRKDPNLVRAFVEAAKRGASTP